VADPVHHQPPPLREPTRVRAKAAVCDKVLRKAKDPRTRGELEKELSIKMRKGR